MNADERTDAIAERGIDTGRTSRQHVHGRWRDFSIYRVPVDLLILNAGNRRFAAELLDLEEQLGRPLDPQVSPSDEASIISILLDDNPRVSSDAIVGRPSKDAVALRSDWVRRGQEQPLWIRPDGFVVNGNRRLASLKRLAGETGSATGVHSYVEVIVLQFNEINDDEMFQMEAREQLTEGLKKRYGDLNVLLTLREAANRQGIEWSNDESIVAIAGQIQDLVGNNPSYAATQLRAIHAMDLYLEYTEEPGKYQRMIGQVEKFRDIGKNQQIVNRDYPERAFDLLVASFRAVQAGLPHLDIRELRKIAVEEPEVFATLADEVEELVTAPGSEAAPPPSTESEDFADSDVEDDESDPSRNESPVQTDPAFPKRDVKRTLDVAIANRKAKQRGDVETTLREAAGRLDQVSADDLRELVTRNRASALTAFVKIREWVEAMSEIDV